MPRDYPDLKTGTLLEPFHLNIIYRFIRKLLRTVAVPPLVIDGLQSIDSPWIFRVSSSTNGFPCVANGNIPARSGSTFGVGSVKSITTTATYTTGALTGATGATDSTAYDVINVSSNTMTSGNGIDSGQYSWAEQGNDGLLYVTPLECS